MIFTPAPFPGCFVDAAHHRVVDAVGLVGEEGGNRLRGALRLAAPGHDAELQILHQTAADAFFQVAQDVGSQGEQLALPDAIFHLDDEAGAHHSAGAGMRGDPRADGLRPGRAGQIPGAEHILRQSQSADEFAGAFHVSRLDHFIMAVRGDCHSFR